MTAEGYGVAHALLVESPASEPTSEFFQALTCGSSS